MNTNGSVQKMVECTRIFKFLAGLNMKFDEVRGRIIGRQPLPSMGEVLSEVKWEESWRSVMLGKKTVTAPIANSALAMPIAATATSRNPNTQRNTEEKTRVWCDFCNKPRETCWKIHGKLVNWKPMERKKNKLGDQSNRNIAAANTAEISSLSKNRWSNFFNCWSPIHWLPLLLVCWHK